MKRQINVRLLACLILVLGVGAGLVHVLHGYLVQRSAALLLRRAAEVGRAGKPAAEFDLLKRYLAYRPDDSAALERYGLILARSNTPEDRTQALAILEKVLTRAPDRTPARRTAAELARALGQVDAAKAHYEILANATAAGDAAAEESLGRCEEETRRYPEALVWYERAIDHDPGKVGAYAAIAHLLRTALKQPERADRIMDAREVKDGLIAKNPRSARAYLDRAAYRRAFAIPGSGDDIKQALALAPDDADVLLAAAGEGADDEAIRLLSRGIELNAAEARFHERIARTELHAGKRPAAIERLKAGVDRLPEDVALRYLLTELQIDERDFAAASAGIGRLRTMKLPPALLDLLDCRILIESRQWTKAARELRPARRRLARPSEPF